jgi:branched-chain amino acid transport system substrate-binding protein
MFGALGAASVAAPALSACTSITTGAPVIAIPVSIGLIVPQAGPNKAIGDELTAGLQLYLNQHNNKLAGHAITIIMAEEGDTAESGKDAVEKLVKGHGVQAITGVVSSTVLSGIRERVESAQTPLIGSNASPTELGGVKYIWRTSYVDNEAGKAIGTYLANKNTGPVFVVSDESAVARDQVSGFTDAFNGTVGHPPLVDSVHLPLAANPGIPLSTLMNNIRGSGAKSVFAAVSGEGALAFFKAYRAANVSAPLYCPGTATEGAALRQFGDVARGVYTAMNYSPDLSNGVNRAFAADYHKAYNNPPSAYAVASYDTAAVLDKAFELAGGDLTGPALNAALSRIGQIDSPRGGWQFNQGRTPLQRWYLRQVRKDGQVWSNVVLNDLAMLG